MQNNNKHIVFLTPGFAKSEKDSTTIPALQVFLKAISKSLPTVKLTLISFQYPHSNKRYNWNGIEVIPLNGKNKRLKKIFIWRKAVITLKKLHKKNPITTIHSFWIGESSSIGQYFTNKKGINHIITVMGQDARVNNIHSKKIIGSNAKIVTLSTNQQKDLLKMYNLKSTLIPWFINTIEFPKMQENSIDILGVGSLNKVKNYLDFIAVISSISKIKKELKVRIIGDGNLKEELAKKIKEMHLENTIELLGKLPRAKVIEEMSKAKILLHTSNYESFGLVFLEALYAGMYVVSYNVGIANSSKKWFIGANKYELSEYCKKILLDTDSNKERFSLTTKEDTMNAYLSLYNA